MTNERQFTSTGIILIAIAIAILIIIKSIDSSREHDGMIHASSEPVIVERYSVKDDGGRPPVIVEVWEVEYKGETIRQLYIKDTELHSNVATNRHMTEQVLRKMVNEGEY